MARIASPMMVSKFHLNFGFFMDNESGLQTPSWLAIRRGMDFQNLAAGSSPSAMINIQ
jgi:hypothetical protein